ncbi:sulfotransferase family 2 domain-containing protein [Actibacterium sp. D379-3]
MAEGQLPPAGTATRRLRYARADYGPLAKNAAHGFAAEHALSIYGARAVYSFIPKNGCSTLRFSLAQANGCIADPGDVNWIHENNHTFGATLAEVLTADYAFVVLRCPYRRLASVFLDKIVGRDDYVTRLLCNAPLKDLPALKVFQRKARRRLRGERPLNPERFTFRDFIALLQHPNGLMANHHWAPQVAFLVYEDYDDVFQLEHFSQVIRTLEARIGFTVQDARRLTDHGTDRLTLDSGVCHADTPIAEIARMKMAGRAPSHSALFDDGLVRAVAQLYADDIAVYTAHFGSDDLLFS